MHEPKALYRTQLSWHRIHGHFLTGALSARFFGNRKWAHTPASRWAGPFLSSFFLFKTAAKIVFRTRGLELVISWLIEQRTDQQDIVRLLPINFFPFFYLPTPREPPNHLSMLRWFLGIFFLVPFFFFFSYFPFLSSMCEYFFKFVNFF